MQRTFSIVKPDAVQNGRAGKVIASLEEAGFKILGLRMIHMSQGTAETFTVFTGSAPSSPAS